LRKLIPLPVWRTFLFSDFYQNNR